MKGDSSRLKENGYTISLKKSEKDEGDGTKYVEGTITKDGKDNGLKFKLKGGEARLDFNIDITGEYNKGSQKGQSASELVPTNVYGKYVEYAIDLNGDKNTKNDWKIFYTDDEA